MLQLLQAVVRERLDAKPGGHLVEPSLREVPLELVIGLEGPSADPAAFSDQVMAAIDDHLDRAIRHAAAFRPGYAYCFRCGGPRCAHSGAPSCRHVLAGYGPTGVPIWQEFPQHVLESGHPDVDRLYDEPPAFLTLAATGSRLHAGVLEAYRDHSYRVLGQLVAGFFSIPTRLHEGRGVIALTFQLGATRGARGAVQLGLNVVGRAPGGEELETLWERQPDLTWRAGVRWAQGILTTLPVRRDSDLERFGARVDGVLRGLARRVAHAERARGRRTRHADDRHLSGARPTRMAIEDARSATAADVLVDERQGTTVVIGERGRTHFFSPDGRLVSSVRYTRATVERRRQKGVWRAASEGEIDSFRRALLPPE